eukprot:TRINITY_DN3054_c0_g1_i8.p1 TRINITY_DN3054_c0_g1~~TRINITY_DN3054_c0_g1_i8.p1  ORF type:complete len:694 (+),score=69.27 TRINITY_DN3054_c0_g1_i8:2123-4204(+)
MSDVIVLPVSFGSVAKIIEGKLDTNTGDVYFQVLSVCRYTPSTIWAASTGIVVDNFKDVYDLVISDGCSKVKCVLHPNMNYGVDQNIIRQNSVIKVKEYKRRNDELKDGVNMFIILVSVEVTTYLEGIFSFRGDQSPSWSTQEYEENPKLEYVPLVGRRGFYMDLYSDDTLLDDRWCIRSCQKKILLNESKSYKEIYQAYSSLEQLFKTDLDEYYLIKEIINYRIKMGNKKSKSMSNSFAIGRVTKKSKLCNWGKMNQDDKYPLRFSMEIQDSSGSIKVNVWSGLCARYYGKIKLGDVILIRKFQIKPAYEDNNGTELSLNPKLSTIEIIPELKDLNLPPMKFNIILDIDSVKKAVINSEDLSYDIAGVVTYISNSFRVSNETDNGFKCFNYKWIFLRFARSGVGGLDIPVKICVNSQLLPFNSIRVGDAAFITTVKIQEKSESRPNFIDTTDFSHIFLNEELSLFGQPLLEEVLEWRNVHKNEFINVVQMLPQISQDFEPERVEPFNSFYIELFSYADAINIYHGGCTRQVLIKDIPELCKSMPYKTREFHFVQGFIEHIKKVSFKNIILYCLTITDPNRESIINLYYPSFPSFPSTHSIVGENISQMLLKSQQQRNRAHRFFLGLMPSHIHALVKQSINSDMSFSEDKFLAFLSEKSKNILFKFGLDIYKHGMIENNESDVVVTTMIENLG